MACEKLNRLVNTKLLKNDINNCHLTIKVTINQDYGIGSCLAPYHSFISSFSTDVDLAGKV